MPWINIEVSEVAHEKFKDLARHFRGTQDETFEILFSSPLSNLKKLVKPKEIKYD